MESKNNSNNLNSKTNIYNTERFMRIISKEPRILDFFTDPNILDREISIYLHEEDMNNIMLGAGDGWKNGFGIKTDIEKMTTIPDNNGYQYNIFICNPQFWLQRYGNGHINAGDALISNLKYLFSHPESKILLCFMDIYNEDHCAKIAELLKDKIYIINSDEVFLMRYLPGKYAHKILVPGGECYTTFIERAWIKDCKRMPITNKLLCKFTKR